MTTARVALVTGAASEIGRATAEVLASTGARVICADLDEAGARAVAAGIGGKSAAVDVASSEQCRAVVEQTVEREGRLDILVNNAGLQHVSPLHEMPEERWEQLLRVMLFGPFYLTRAALPHMYRQGSGRVVNIASVHALVASPNKSAYVSAKHGLLGLTRTAALEAAPHGVTVNAVCPGYVRTPLVENQLADLARTEGVPEPDVVDQVLLTNVPLKRLLEPGEVGECVRYLCSDAAAGITGAAIVLDGGWTAR